VTWATACKEAGVDGLKVHDLRRTGVSVFRRYNIVSDEDMRKAPQQIDRPHNEQMMHNEKDVDAEKIM